MEVDEAWDLAEATVVAHWRMASSCGWLISWHVMASSCSWTSQLACQLGGRLELHAGALFLVWAGGWWSLAPWSVLAVVVAQWWAAASSVSWSVRLTVVDKSKNV